MLEALEIGAGQGGLRSIFVRSELASDGRRFGVLEVRPLTGRYAGRQNKVEGRQAPAQPKRIVGENASQR